MLAFLGSSLPAVAFRSLPLFLASHVLGSLCRRLALPQITGYLLTGVTLGPHGLQLLGLDTTRRLWAVENLCLAVIGIAAGSELQLVELQRREYRSSVLLLTGAVAAASWAFVFPAVLALAPHMPFLQAAELPRRLGVASLAATLSIARSPASMIAVLREMGAKGAFCSLVVNVTVLKDVVVLILFALNLQLVTAAEETEPGTPLLVAARCVAIPLMRLSVSAALGAAGGTALGALLAIPRSLLGDRGALPAALLLLAAGLFLGARALPAEPLLVCVAAGALAANRREERGERAREDLAGLLEELMPLTNLVFFTLTGAALAVDALAATAPAAVLLHLVRLAALVVATRTAAPGVPREQRAVLWRAMVTQAGVALGLARAVLHRFPSSFGVPFHALMVATVILNQLLGPPLFRSALVAVGEGSRDQKLRLSSVTRLPVSAPPADEASSVAD